MRPTVVVVFSVSVFALSGCAGDAPLAPTRTGTSGSHSDVPPDLLADYSIVTLASPGYVLDVNDSGDAVGISAAGPVLWHGPSHIPVSLPITPAAIANDGRVVGLLDGRAASWKEGRVVVLDTATSNARAVCRCASATIVGSVVVNGIKHAAIWLGGVRIDAGLPEGATEAEFVGIANGFIVGNAVAPTRDPVSGSIYLAPQSFRWSHASGWQQLGSLGTTYSSAIGVNSAGTAVDIEKIILNPDLLGIVWDLGYGRSPLYGIPPLLRSILPSAINESGALSANTPDDGLGLGTGALALVVNGSVRVLPPGNYGDVTTSINSSNVVGGQSSGNAVLWTPNQ